MHRMLIGSRMLLSALPTDGNAANSPDHNQKAILVTGASTGIGRKVTERLAADGYFVYAGARKEADLEALGAIHNVQAVRLDVTKPEDIDAAVETVTKAGRADRVCRRACRMAVRSSESAVRQSRSADRAASGPLLPKARPPLPHVFSRRLLPAEAQRRLRSASPPQ